MWSVLVKAHASVNKLQVVEGVAEHQAYGAVGDELVGERAMGRRPRQSRRHPPGSPHALPERAIGVDAVARSGSLL